MHKKFLQSIILFTTVFTTFISGMVLSSANVSADESVVDNVTINVPVACTFSGTGMTSHNASIMPGNVARNIGNTTMKVFCNDSDGFAIYAIGYTDDTEGKTVLTSSALGPTYDIATGTGTSGNSQWAMRLTTPTSPTPTYPITIQNNYDSSSYHIVPNVYDLVAKRLSATDVGDNAEGSTMNSTYQAYVSPTQVAGTYIGKVKYTMVHPNDAPAPVPVSKNLYYAINGSADNYTLTISDSDITSGAVASGPVAIDGYTYSTIPWLSYVDQIKSVIVSGNVAPISTSYWFSTFRNCASWDLDDLKTDNVTDMKSMFANAGYNAVTFTLDLSSWNTSSVTDMSSMFSQAGHNATTWSIGDLSSWDTSSVTSMKSMFSDAGYSASSFNLNLSSWDVSGDLQSMFSNAGYSASSFNLNLSSWDTSNVTNMYRMFYYAGYSATNWSISGLSSWNTSSLTTTSNMFQAAGHNAVTFTLDLSSWDTSSVLDANYMFSSAGYNALTWSVGDISSWNTSQMESMNQMFSSAGYRATNFALDLSSWDTSNVAYMSNMFWQAGRNATNFTLDLSSWNTSNVTNMTAMFSNAGRYATTWSVTIPQNNGAVSSPITNTTSRLYGKTTSTYAAPPSGKSFTLAN